jgi:hypothetical protein
MLREQRDPPCDTAEEQYQPTSVDTVLGNTSVTLTRYVPGKGLEDVKEAPTARDIAGLGDDYYLNLRGHPLGETCVYAKHFARMVREGSAPKIAYAHIAREAGHSEFSCATPRISDDGAALAGGFTRRRWHERSCSAAGSCLRCSMSRRTYLGLGAGGTTASALTPSASCLQSAPRRDQW